MNTRAHQAATPTAATPSRTTTCAASVEHNVCFMVASLRDPGSEPELAAPQETGRRRAHQGAPVPEVLRAFRIGFNTLWGLLAERARADPDTSTVHTLLAAAAAVWQRTDEYASALTETHRATTAQMLIDQQERRSALVDVILTGEPAPDAGPWEVSRLLNLPADSDYMVVVAETHRTADAGLPRIEARLAERAVVSAWRLTPTHQTGLVALRHGQREETLTLLRDTTGTRTGVSPTFRSVSDTPRALEPGPAGGRRPTTRPDRRRRVPRRSARRSGRPGPRRESLRVVREVFGAVLELPTEDRTTLLDTLAAWFDHAGSARADGRGALLPPQHRPPLGCVG